MWNENSTLTSRRHSLVLQNFLNSEDGKLQMMIFCSKEIGPQKTVDFGGNYFKTRLVSWQLKVLLHFWGDFPSEREFLWSLQSLPALRAERFGCLPSLPFSEDGMKKIYTFDVCWRDGTVSTEIGRWPKSTPSAWALLAYAVDPTVQRRGQLGLWHRLGLYWKNSFC